MVLLVITDKHKIKIKKGLTYYIQLNRLRNRNLVFKFNKKYMNKSISLKKRFNYSYPIYLIKIFSSLLINDGILNKIYNSYISVNDIIKILANV